MGPAGTSGDQAEAIHLQAGPSSSGELQYGACAEEGNSTAVVAKVQQYTLKNTNKKKPTALDKQYQLVASIQRRNRQQAAERHEQDQQQRLQQQQLADFSHQLRTLILSGDVDTIQQSWQPAAAAARLKEAQQVAAEQTQQLLVRLSHGQTSAATNVLDPDTLRPKYSPLASRTTATAAGVGDTSASGECKQTYEAYGFCDVNAADDVDSFLDSLLQQATAKKAALSSNGDTPKQPSQSISATTAAATAEPLQQHPAEETTSRPSTAASTSRKHKHQQTAKPAWAVPQQQQAEAEAAAEEAEEAELLNFAEQLNWQELISKLDDEQLAVAFQELEFAEAAAAAGDSAADKNWKASFVTALNHVALQGVAATAAERGGAGGAGSCAGETHSEAPSSASQIRRAEEKCSRRQKLLDRLTRLQGSSVKGASFVNGTSGPGSIAGSVGMFGSTGTAAAAAKDDSWDCSTRADEDGVRMVQQQLKVLEATDVLAENPEMKGVHSVASVMAMLQKKEVQG